MSTVNPNEAPDGYLAAKAPSAYSCYGCAFNQPPEIDSDSLINLRDIVAKLCVKSACGEHSRTDEQPVIFVTKDC